ncbi:hypothetical protein SCHPADRAFT_903980 [Schizopora paradoxa]|uniref:N-acetyltransferase domain-containing protein n=1 Tax=Schizopora paradoxa TaxID=27342 RepID=A0A0H2RW36_9AGAM|nr:hypothetical protein SCHPADRAFT_903980 [Schizopora paradoxa]
MATTAALVRVRKLIKPCENDIDRSARTLADAFKGDIFTKNLLGGSTDEALAFHLQRCQIAAAVVGGEVYVAEIPSGIQLAGDGGPETENRIVGAALWFPPGREMLDSNEQLQAGPADFLALLEPSLLDWWKAVFLPGFSTLADKAYGKGGKLNSWHLLQIGVHPMYQRRGIASHLIEVVKKKALSSNSIITLEAETELNVRLSREWLCLYRLSSTSG